MGYWITHLATFFVIFDLGSPIVQSDLLHMSTTILFLEVLGWKI